MPTRLLSSITGERRTVNRCSNQFLKDWQAWPCCPSIIRHHSHEERAASDDTPPMLHVIGSNLLHIEKMCPCCDMTVLFVMAHSVNETPDTIKLYSICMAPIGKGQSYSACALRRRHRCSKAYREKTKMPCRLELPSTQAVKPEQNLNVKILRQESVRVGDVITFHR